MLWQLRISKTKPSIDSSVPALKGNSFARSNTFHMVRLFSLAKNRLVDRCLPMPQAQVVDDAFQCSSSLGLQSPSGRRYNLLFLCAGKTNTAANNIGNITAKAFFEAAFAHWCDYGMANSFYCCNGCGVSVPCIASATNLPSSFIRHCPHQSFIFPGAVFRSKDFWVFAPCCANNFIGYVQECSVCSVILLSNNRYIIIIFLKL